MMDANDISNNETQTALRMHSYLSYFGLQEVSQKMQSVGLTNFDAMSYDWYNHGVDGDEEGSQERKKQYRELMRQCLNRNEIMAVVYLLQYFEW